MSVFIEPCFIILAITHYWALFCYIGYYLLLSPVLLYWLLPIIEPCFVILAIIHYWALFCYIIEPCCVTLLSPVLLHYWALFWYIIEPCFVIFSACEVNGTMYLSGQEFYASDMCRECECNHGVVECAQDICSTYIPVTFTPLLLLVFKKIFIDHSIDIYQLCYGLFLLIMQG